MRLILTSLPPLTHIFCRAEAEDKAWIEADKFYDKLRASFDAEQEHRRQKGKPRADTDVLPRPDLVPPHLQAGVQNILDVLSGPREIPPPDPRLAHIRHMVRSCHIYLQNEY